jgi:hypothetical protein
MEILGLGHNAFTTVYIPYYLSLSLSQSCRHYRHRYRYCYRSLPAHR